MIDSLLMSPHLSEYICSLEPDLPPFLEEMYREARANEVPVIRRETMGMIRFLLTLNQPEHILEIGTAIGFSACFMAQNTAKAKIDTIEKVPARIEAAKKNLQAFNGAIKLLEGDAEAVLKDLCEKKNTYDFIFLDAAKAQYPVYLPYLVPMLRSGGILLTDNILQEGSLAESKFTVTRRDRTIHMRMREYVDLIFHTEELTSVLLPVGDGITLSVRK